VSRERVKHAADNFNGASTKLLEELIKAGLDDIAIDHIKVKQLDD